MKDVFFLVGLLLYMSIGIVAFGHSAAKHDKFCDNHKVVHMLNGPDCYTPSPFYGLASTVFWPLYLSWELWDEALKVED